MWIDCPQSLCHCHCSRQTTARSGLEPKTHVHKKPIHTRTHWSCTCTSTYKIDCLFYLARLQAWALCALHMGGMRKTYVIYQSERATARGLIVNHRQHYWTSPSLANMDLCWQAGGACYKSVNNTQDCVHTNFHEAWKHKSPPPHTHTHLLGWHMYTHKVSEMIINVITSLWPEIHFSCVGSLTLFPVLYSSKFLSWIMLNKMCRQEKNTGGF